MSRIVLLWAALSIGLSWGWVGCTDDEPVEEEQGCELDDSCDEEEQDSGADTGDGDSGATGDSGTPGDSGGSSQGDVCGTDADCSYNGICSAGQCACVTPWQGDVCDRLTMGTVDKSVYGYRDGFPYTTSWGGSVKYDDASGKYVMLVSEYVEECANWGWNSTVVLATSSTPEGPYEREFTLFGVMSHEAMLARAPSGEWVVYFTASEQGNGRPRMGEDDYTDGDVCLRGGYDEACECPGDPDKGSKDPTWMSYTTTPLDYGSWSTPVKIFDPGNDFTDSFPDGTQAESIDANFNGVILEDGSFVGLWRTWQCTADLVEPWSETLAGADEACFSVPHAIKASAWDDSSTYEIEAQKGDLHWLFPEQYYVSPTQHLGLGIEDPMVYQDSRSPNVYHAIFHEMFVPYDNVSHAYSEDGVSWTYTGPVFDTDAQTNMPMVTFTDGTQAGLACERPQLIVKDGVPSHIIIGGIPTGLSDDSAFPADTGNLEDAADEYGWPGGATMVIPLTAE